MHTYIVLLRGVNVGGKNKVPMAALKQCLEKAGFENVRTYIQSGNILLESRLQAKAVGRKIEKCLPSAFVLDSSVIKVLVLTPGELHKIIQHRPKGFGDRPTVYHSDVIFLMGIKAHEAMTAFNPREGVDAVWAGDGVIYSQRLSAQRTKSRLSAIMMSPLYKSMTIRNWNTTTKLLELVKIQTPSSL